MILVRFMEVSLGYARIQVNTLHRVNNHKGLGPRFINGPVPGPFRPDGARSPGISNLGEISGDTMIGRGIAAHISVI
jgi:hypothetical protein